MAQSLQFVLLIQFLLLHQQVQLILFHLSLLGHLSRLVHLVDLKVHLDQQVLSVLLYHPLRWDLLAQLAQLVLEVLENQLVPVVQMVLFLQFHHEILADHAVRLDLLDQ